MRGVRIGGVKRLALIAGLNLVICAILIEGLSLIGFAINGGRFYYTRIATKKVDQKTEDFFGGNFFLVLDLVYHPYFGYVERLSEKTNNHGFRNPVQTGNCCDFPYHPKEDEFIIGIFGGSVAGAVGFYARKLDYFRKRLNSQPEFAKRRIVVLNFAMGGYRQPQQLMILSYYLLLGQKFDAIINIDGFNEVVTATTNNANGVDFTMPPTDIWHGMARHIERVNMRSGSDADIMSAYHIWHERSHRRAADACFLASCFVYNKVLAIYHAYRRDELAAENAAKWEKVSHFVIPAPHKQIEHRLTSENPDTLMDRTVEFWENSTRAMARLAANAESFYIHILQPNLHFPVNKRIEPKNPKHPYGYVIDSVERGYPKMIARIAKMRADGIRVVNATGLFDDYDGEIYSDDCCHYNNTGIQMMDDLIVDQLREAILKATNEARNQH